MPALRLIGQDALLAMDPERAHGLTLKALNSGLVAGTDTPDPKELGLRLAGLKLPNPVGMAAGFDKNAKTFSALERLGFGFCEVGTLTPRPQPGNPRPRLFRIMAARAVINRMGFNNEGHEIARKRIEATLSHAPETAAPGINIGANKDSADFVADYVAGVDRFSDVAAYLAVNISSPNTPGLRGLQGAEALNRLLGETLAARQRQRRQPPLFLKIAPDMDEHQMDDMARIISRHGLDGLIISNTTISRPMVSGLEHAQQEGGLSGAPLFELSTIQLARMRQRVGADMPIIGVGGIHDADSAIAKLEAGANALQLYTALVYGGLDLLQEIKTGLARAVRARGLEGVGELSGLKNAQWAARSLPGQQED
ncbi:MAG TPA: quinone-dependent dihydroorotate dehydrogenase [Devosia sp.]|nr:quinone-dependent dihydroorotate dehydrogenase [Devosia sp.]